MRTSMTFGILAAALMTTTSAHALDQVKFGTNWLAQAEHGGYYQAVADGTYEKYGLDVEIIQGGPQAANRSLLLAGKIDFFMAGNMLQPLNALAQDIPVIEVAAIFQKDPQVIIAHPDQGLEKFEDLATLPTIFMGKDGFASYFQWMKSAYEGFKDEQYKPYTFNPGPFLADKQSAQQGYITSEPFAIEEVGGIKPKLFLLADAGFETYSTMIEGRKDFVMENKDLTQRFVDATIEGWYNYLYGDNAAANELIKKDNPEITDAQITFSIDTMKSFGLVESGEALEQGIGCMTDEKQKGFYDTMVTAGVVEAGFDITDVYTTEFVCKGVGMDLKG
ncbi:ABC transporter substrate-binding protein [Roseibium limicola]|uniref:ABC transporter substrate-binding protein n=1 Tax=Roseibium limicola TaxID=2816037 RepID=A0A939ERK8_9HYPH|nr:ABC transporter substrate-binding protein [Roseibium limicola]MBO0347025.1 ABC transporter substrate-binding protein [Roseibium limicola]